MQSTIIKQPFQEIISTSHLLIHGTLASIRETKNKMEIVLVETSTNTAFPSEENDESSYYQCKAMVQTFGGELVACQNIATHGKSVQKTPFLCKNHVKDNMIKLVSDEDLSNILSTTINNNDRSNARLTTNQLKNKFLLKAFLFVLSYVRKKGIML